MVQPALESSTHHKQAVAGPHQRRYAPQSWCPHRTCSSPCLEHLALKLHPPLISISKGQPASCMLICLPCPGFSLCARWFLEPPCGCHHRLVSLQMEAAISHSGVLDSSRAPRLRSESIDHVCLAHGCLMSTEMLLHSLGSATATKSQQRVLPGVLETF